MYRTHNISSSILLVLLAVLVMVLPVVVSERLMNPTQSGKTIFFLWGILVILPVWVIVFLSGTFTGKSGLSWLGLAAAAWFSYILANSFLKGASLSLSIMEFTGLALMYVVLRFIPAKRFNGLFLALMAGGLIQAVYGNLQLWGNYPSHHSLFKLTGSFFNPGPYAGFLSVVFPVAFGFWLFGWKTVTTLNVDKKHNERIAKVWKPFLDRVERWLHKLRIKTGMVLTGEFFAGIKNQAVYYFSAAVLLSILLVLPASQSRAAWLAVLASSGFLLAVKYKDSVKNWSNKPVLKKKILVLLIAGTMVSGLAGMYFMKKDSADGRALIWKVTLNIIGDYPLTGAGFGGFKTNYMNYQAAWFKQHPQSGEAMVAGDVNYAFNELLQQTAEHGVAGTFLLALVFLSAFTIRYPRPSGVEPNRQLLPDNKTRFILISKALLVAFVVFSMFSYPVQVLPVKVGLALALACLAAYSPKVNIKLAAGKVPVTGFIILVSGVAVFLIYFGAAFLKQRTEALKDWKYAFTLYSMGAYGQSVEEYEKALPVMKQNGDFLTNYGKALSMAGQHEKAVIALQDAGKHYPNTVVFTSIGDSYKSLGQIKQAEGAYLHAWHMNPGRFYPKYLLAKLYDESGQREKAMVVARELLAKEVKVESTAIEEIKQEMQEILEH